MRIKTKYYHASARRYSPGDVVVGHSWCPSHRGLWVFLSNSPVPHYTIASIAVKENWHVYEVVPNGKCKLSNFECEIIAESVIIVSKVGNARGIHQNWIRKRDPEKSIGSAVEFTSRKKAVVQDRFYKRIRSRLGNGAVRKKSKDH